eukprot:3958762-Prymnesium_polylepis.1
MTLAAMPDDVESPTIWIHGFLWRTPPIAGVVCDAACQPEWECALPGCGDTVVLSSLKRCARKSRH